LSDVPRDPIFGHAALTNPCMRNPEGLYKYHDEIDRGFWYYLTVSPSRGKVVQEGILWRSRVQPVELLRACLS